MCNSYLRITFHSHDHLHELMYISEHVFTLTSTHSSITQRTNIPTLHSLTLTTHPHPHLNSTTYIPTMSENVQKTTTQVRGDHTKWQCHKMVNEPGHARCVATMSMNVNTCTHCGQRRGKNAVALAQNDDVLGSLVDFEADGTEKWHYNLKVNGVHN